MTSSPQPSEASTFFNRDFENTYGFLTPEMLPQIDWTKKEQIELLFPAWKRAFLALGGKAASIGAGIDVSLNLKKPYYDKDLFVGTYLEIEPSKRCAVYGINGSGKTCLFEAIASGDLPGFPPHINVHHMKELESNEQADKVSVLDTVLCSHKFRRVLLACQAKLQALLETGDDKYKSAYEENLRYVEQGLSSVQSDTATKRAQQMLRVLGFDEKGEQAPLSSLSGGLRMRVALASAFFLDAQLLLLDEPTNHLDMPSVLWLENRLRAYKGAFLLVTHDRTLLENVVTSVMLIQDEKLHYFSCGFAEFEKRKKQLDKDRERMIDQYLKKNRNVDPSHHTYPRYKGYRDWLSARAERRQLMEGKFRFKAPKPLELTPGATTQAECSLIKVDGVRFSYDVEKNLPFIFDTPISYEVKMGTRVGIMGPNGAGKSTFLKLITGKLQPVEGTITINPEYKLAYFGQHSTKELKMDMSPIEFMIDSFPKANKGDLMFHLGKTSVSDTVANKRIRYLSFSQRSCVIFAKLTFNAPHLLIMDEPTNFLDLESVDSLISAATKFPGGLITVTHNRTFLGKCSKEFLSIVPGAFLEFPDMKTAERATYSFISALEEGRDIDVKNAIVQNRGGGAAHTEEEQQARRKALSAQQKAAQLKLDAKEAEQKKIEDAKADKEAKRKAKVAAQRLDWKADEKVYVNHGGQWQEAVVLQNMPSVGVRVQLTCGTMKMVNANKLKEEPPNGVKPKPAASSSAASAKPGQAGGVEMVANKVEMVVEMVANKVEIVVNKMEMVDNKMEMVANKVEIAVVVNNKDLLVLNLLVEMLMAEAVEMEMVMVVVMVVVTVAKMMVVVVLPVVLPVEVKRFVKN
eukprot:CAMPEP_0201474896 /NCGR_PEP_ID=MMETSP0151_2-20130828/378_1 /ASSEMBLY_ACC=CAM_ASM_000257 /TAXON_ID=200890 /ORGANISM="Paramoeba atlantica, Strain 621/1 / CCAP 1560/9" /LENGTH=857 /DNA_ID=CAMNT_0047854825 /DNA_START=50 /DNA_END=2624 /DNA_ORIENTATION=-